jgi:hypothetical protein
MTQKDTVNVIEGTRKYSAQVSDRWMTRVTDVPGGSRGARLTEKIGTSEEWGEVASSGDAEGWPAYGAKVTSGIVSALESRARSQLRLRKLVLAMAVIRRRG